MVTRSLFWWWIYTLSDNIGYPKDPCRSYKWSYMHCLGGALIWLHDNRSDIYTLIYCCWVGRGHNIVLYYTACNTFKYIHLILNDTCLLFYTWNSRYCSSSDQTSQILPHYPWYRISWQEFTRKPSVEGFQPLRFCSQARLGAVNLNLLVLHVWIVVRFITTIDSLTTAWLSK